MIKNKNQKIRVLELFAGVGGFRLGLEKASSIFDTIYSNQWEPERTKQWAYECYISHFGKSENYTNQDINKIKHNVPQHDLLVGGFPCQDYSVARTKNNAQGIGGKKGVLWWDIKDIIVNKKPTFILLENVDRLVKSPANQKGRDFGIMLKTLYEAGYNAEWRIINAADYGLVQRRRRIFIFAYKASDYGKIFNNSNIEDLLKINGFFADIFPIRDINSKKDKVIVSFTNNEYEDLVEFSNSFTSQFYNSGVLVNGEILSLEIFPNLILSDPISKIIETDYVDKKYFISESIEKFKYLKSYKFVPRLNPDGEIYFYTEGNMTFPDSLDKPARTMLTSEASINRSTHVIEDFKTKEYRLLTPLECERINGFDDNWTNTGMPEKFRYFCMGNALVVPLVTKMGIKIVQLWSYLND